MYCQCGGSWRSQKMLKDRILDFGELIKELLCIYDENGEIPDDGWAVYYKDTSKIENNTECCITDWVTVTDDDEEIFPALAALNDMYSYVTDEIIVDVITAYMIKNSRPSVEQLIDAVNYYLENDCFIETGSVGNAYRTPQIIIKKEITDKRILMKIKKAFSLEMPLGEFLQATRKIPYIISASLSAADAKRIIKENGLTEYVTVDL